MIRDMIQRLVAGLVTGRFFLTQILTQNRKFRYGRGSTKGKIPFVYPYRKAPNGRFSAEKTPRPILLSSRSGVRVPSGVPTFSANRIWWVWPSWLRRQIVALKIVGSSPIIHPIKFRFLFEIGTFSLLPSAKVHTTKFVISIVYCWIDFENQILLYQIRL